jgi:broad specificity phosphatase PhoE
MAETTEPAACTLYIVRHGETEWNALGILIGQCDSPLTKRGVAQVRDVAEELRSVAFVAVFSSDTLRARRTAELITLERPLPIRTSHELRERYYGDWEGQPVSRYRESTKSRYEWSLQLPLEEQWQVRMDDDVEADGEVAARFMGKLLEIAADFPAERVLVATHGGCIRTFLVRIGYATQRQMTMDSFRNAGYVKVLCDGARFVVKEVRGINLEGTT